MGAALTGMRLPSAATVPPSIASLAGLSFAPRSWLAHTVREGCRAPRTACRPLPRPARRPDPRTCAHCSPSESGLLHPGLQARSCPGTLRARRLA